MTLEQAYAQAFRDVLFAGSRFWRYALAVIVLVIHHRACR